MIDSKATNYNGEKGGKDAPIIPLGQTSGKFGNDPFIQTKTPQNSKLLKTP